MRQSGATIIDSLCAELTTQSPGSLAPTEAREPSFWQASTYGVSETLSPLLEQDAKANAVATLGAKGVST